MPLFQLSNDLVFPPVHYAEPDGLLAIGGDLSIERLLLAYSEGIFPWYSKGEPVLWWSPNPRMVLLPEELKVSKSMRPYFNQPKWEVTFDLAFEKVINHCSKAPRKNQSGTWIVPTMKKAYIGLHEAGYAHSVEVWSGEKLIGGLYGVSLGAAFFGESMFSLEKNASKFAFIRLVNLLHKRRFQLIDCQVYTAHLESLGAREISREDFLNYLSQCLKQPTLKGNWQNLLLSGQSEIK